MQFRWQLDIAKEEEVLLIIVVVSTLVLMLVVVVGVVEVVMIVVAIVVVVVLPLFDLRECSSEFKMWVFIMELQFVLPQQYLRHCF